MPSPIYDDEPVELLVVQDEGELVVEQVTTVEVLEVLTPVNSVDDAEPVVEILELSGDTEIFLFEEPLVEILEVAEAQFLVPPDRFFEKLLASGLSAFVPSTEHSLPKVRAAALYTPDGDEVSIAFNVVQRDVTVLSNVNLADHRLVIF